MNRRTENERFCVWQGRRSRLSGDSRCRLTPSKHKISRLNAKSFCVGALSFLLDDKSRYSFLMTLKCETENTDSSDHVTILLNEDTKPVE